MERGIKGCSGQVLLEACLWTLLLVAVVIAASRGYQAEFRAYKASLATFQAD